MDSETASTGQTSTSEAPATTSSASATSTAASTGTTTNVGGEREASPSERPAGSLPKTDSQGNDSKGTVVAVPRPVQHARAYAKATGKWPKAYQPTEQDHIATGNKLRPSAEQPGDTKAPLAGGTPKGGAPAAPGAAKGGGTAADPKDMLREQYAAAANTDAEEELYRADQELARNGYSPEDLLALKPERRLVLASAAVKRLDGFRRALGSTQGKAPSDSGAKAKPAAGQSAPSHASRNATTLNPELADRMKDAFTFLSDADRNAAESFLDAALSGRNAPSQDPDRGTEDEPSNENRSQGEQFTPAEMELATGNMEFAIEAVVKEHPWAKGNTEALTKIVQRAHRLADSERVVLSARRLTEYMKDAAALIFARDIRQSKNAAGIAAKAAAAGANLSGPAPKGSTVAPRQLTQSEHEQTARRAAKDSNGDPERNKALLKQYRDELAARPI